MISKLEYAAKIAAEAANFYHCQDYKRANSRCQKSLSQDPANLLALTTLGNLHFLQQDYAKALLCYQKISALYPDNPTNLLNLANAFFELKDYTQVIYYAQQVLDSDSQSLLAWNLLGNAFLEQENYADSISALEQGQKLDPQDFWLHNSLSRAWQKQGDFDKAFAAAWRALELSNGTDSQQLNLGYLLYEAVLENSSDSLLLLAQKWLDYYPQNPLVIYMSNAILHNSKITIADPNYVRHIFDDFASGFEEVLQSLNYQAPQYIAEFMSGFYASLGFKKLRILDAGCGTGLCGKFLKKYASWRGLDGVDLSSQMLAQAQSKKLYSHLYCEELLTYLQTSKKRYDLIVAADVFTYFGELDSLFEKLATKLHSNGRLIFTVTQNNHSQQDFFLHPSGRFHHHQNYLNKLLQKFGFWVEKFEPKALRFEGDSAVMGYVISAVLSGN